MLRAPKMFGLFGLLGLTGCNPDALRLPVALNPGDFVAGGEWEGGRLARPFVSVVDESGALALEIQGEAANLVVFRWSGSEVVRPNGELLELKERRDVKIGNVGDGCGRCSDPFAERGQIVSSGDLCPPPLFADTFFGERQIDRSSAPFQPLILYPGDCECPNALLASKSPEPATWNYLTDPEQDVYHTGFGNGHGALLMGRDSFWLNDHRIPTPFPGLLPSVGTRVARGLLFAVPTPSNRLRNSGSLTAFDLVLTSSAADSILDRIETDLIAVNSMEVVRDDVVLIAGTRGKLNALAPETGVIEVCKTEPSLVCKILNPYEGASDGAVVRLGTQWVGLLWGSQMTSIAFDEIPDPEWIASVDAEARGLRLEDDRLIPFETQIFTDSLQTVSDVVAGNGAIFGCTSSAWDGPDSVFRLRVGGADGPKSEVFACPKFRCRGVLRDGEDIVATFGDRLTRFDKNGELVGEPCSIGGLTRFESELQYTRILNETESLVRLRDGQWLVSSETSTVVHAAVPTAPFVAISEAPDDPTERWLFQDTRWSRVRGGRITESHELEIPLVAATGWATPFDDKTTLVGTRSGWLKVAQDGSAKPFSGEDDIARAVRVRPGIVLAMTKSGRLMSLVANGERIETSEIPLSLDDPRTASIEELPEDCGVGPQLLDLAAKGGRAWVVGCGGLVIEIIPRGATFETSRILFQEGVADELSRPRLMSVTGLCVDRFATGFEDSRFPVGKIYDVQGPDYAPKLLTTPDATPGFFTSPIGLSLQAGELRTLYSEASASTSKLAFIDRSGSSRGFARTYLGDVVHGTSQAVFGPSDAVLLTGQGRAIHVQFP